MGKSSPRIQGIAQNRPAAAACADGKTGTVKLKVRNPIHLLLKGTHKIVQGLRTKESHICIALLPLSVSAEMSALKLNDITVISFVHIAE